MPKISVSVPLELLEYLDTQGQNRSQVIVTILNQHRLREKESVLAQVYADYARLCAEDDGDWWPGWERAAAQDQDAWPLSQPGRDLDGRFQPLGRDGNS